MIENRLAFHRAGRVFSLLLIGALVMPSWAAKKKMKGDDLTNLIIQGENRLRVSARAPAIEWEVSPYKDMPQLLANNTVLSSLQPPAITQPPVALTNKVESQKTASPWLADIQEPPLLTLKLKASKKSTSDPEEPRSWVFLVKDSQGKVFHEIKKKSVIPATISWDGFGKGGPLHVGFDYTYIFSAVDKAGNTERFAGKPFRVNAFRYGRTGKSVTLLAPKVVFDGDDSAQISKNGAFYLTEIKDALRTNFGKTVTVTAYERDAKFAKTRADAVRDALAKALDWPPEKMTAQGLTIKTGGHSYVEINAR